MTEREKLLSGLEYNSRDEELIGMYRKVYKGLIMGRMGTWQNNIVCNNVILNRVMMSDLILILLDFTALRYP
ncbi:Uncharacterised protein [Serratia marcescens]|nr:Uncharacterised protein [Serratia marcescens]